MVANQTYKKKEHKNHTTTIILSTIKTIKTWHQDNPGWAWQQEKAESNLKVFEGRPLTKVIREPILLTKYQIDLTEPKLEGQKDYYSCLGKKKNLQSTYIEEQ